jgi:hypothetical protein
MDGPRTITTGITVQPNEITEELRRPISQELLARDVTRFGVRRQGWHPPQYPHRVHLERFRDRHVHHEERAEASGLGQNPMVAMTIDNEVHPPKILLSRGRAELDFVDGIPDEFLQAPAPTR